MATVRTISTMLVFLFYWINSGAHDGGVMAQTSETAVTVTAPLNPVKEGGILSVHCRVERFQTAGQDVIITRIRNDGEPTEIITKLTTGNQIKPESDTENRMFIAKRLLKDGSTVFFLSVTDISRADEAVYKCSIVDGDFNVVALDWVKIIIQYFPTEPPTCASTPEMPIVVLEREEVTFNCSSPAGNPPFDVVWIKMGADQTPEQKMVKFDHMVYSTMTIRPTLADHHESIYVCEVSSKVFRGQIYANPYVKRCYIGPLRVIFNPTTPPPTRITTSQSPVLTTPYPNSTTTTQSPVLTTPYPTPAPTMTEECKEFCRLEQEPTIFYWTIATVIAGILAIFFLIMGIVILIKYCIALHSAKTERGRGSRGRPYLVPAEEVDAGVEFRRDDNRVSCRGLME